MLASAVAEHLTPVSPPRASRCDFCGRQTEAGYRWCALLCQARAFWRDTAARYEELAEGAPDETSVLTADGRSAALLAELLTAADLRGQAKGLRLAEQTLRRQEASPTAAEKLAQVCDPPRPKAPKPLTQRERIAAQLGIEPAEVRYQTARGALTTWEGPGWYRASYLDDGVRWTRIDEAVIAAAQAAARGGAS